MLKITHVITGLNTGGAEMSLLKLLTHTDRTAFEPQVISLTDIGPVGERLTAAGVRVRALGMRSGLPNPLAVHKLARWLRTDQPHVVQTWMYHADLIGGLAARWAGRLPVAWGIRQSNLEPRGNKRTTIWTARACARLSRWLPARIVCCAEAARRTHAGIGYSADRMVVIPNGFDLSQFRPDPAARLAVRRELGLADDALLVGLMARFDPQKDHRNFIAAAAHLHARLPDVQFVLCGQGVGWENAELAGWIEAAGIHRHCHLLGQRADMPRLMAALDISVLSSFGEGFPTVVGEAMACAVPCVVTDVGDAAVLVGDTGKVVPPRDPAALAAACHGLIAAGPVERSRLGLTARQRVQQHYSLAAMVSRYEALYRELAFNRF